MSNFVNTIESLGDNVVADSIVDRSITVFNDDLVVSLGSSAFYSCSALTSVNLPNVTSISSSAFYGCSKLESVNLPNVTSLGSSAFYSCSALTSVNLPKVTSIANNAFSNCSVLTTLILRSSTVCTLSGTSAFNNAPFAVGKAGGTVYVPQALIESYQTATNWKTLYNAGTCNFVAIEGSDYE